MQRRRAFSGPVGSVLQVGVLRLQMVLGATLGATFQGTSKNHHKNNALDDGC